MDENKKDNGENQDKPKIDPNLMDHLEKGAKIGKSKEANYEEEKNDS